MRRDLVLIVALLSVAQAKICPSIDARNDPSALEVLRNCTVILGHLYFVLMHDVPDPNIYRNYSFPELTEVSDFMVVFLIRNLTNLGIVFPNLRVIRGNRLFGDYALSVWNVDELKEIGLTNLQRIGKGDVIVSKCPQLCYVYTIDWQALGASKLEYPSPNLDCNSHLCPNECAGHCWNYQKCQRTSREFCMHYQDDGKCVEKCPDSKVTNDELMRCMTKEECTTMLNGSWWVFQNACVQHCPLFYYKNETAEGGCYKGENYVKWCTPELIINTINAFEKLYGCTHINGSLDLRISGQKLTSDLEKNLGNIVSISGFLKIGRSNTIRSLDFFKNLTEIGGKVLDNHRYALFVYENQNLARLWNFSGLSILNGDMAFHDNPQLCVSEINSLEEVVKSRGNERTTLIQYSNGYKSICNEKDMNVTTLKTNPTNITFTWPQPEGINNETIVGYNIYYVSEEYMNISSTKDECALHHWDGLFVTTNTATLHSLTPYTRYAFYIKIYMNVPQQTPIYYFVTAPDLPTEVLGFTAVAHNDSTVILTWKPPQHTNGPLSHYQISRLLIDDFLPKNEERNYCTHPFVPQHQEQPQTLHGFDKNTSCSCEFETIFNNVRLPSPSCYENDLEQCMRSIYFKPNQQDPYFSEIDAITRRALEMQDDTQLQVVRLQANLTTYQFEDLQHFTLYVFYLEACNINGEEVQCGKSVMGYVRTRRNKEADIVAYVRVTVNGKNAVVEWSKPDKTNSVLVAYHMEYKRTDSEHSKVKSECISRNPASEIVKHKLSIVKLSPGKYAVRIQAISFAGPGVFSEWKEFEVSPEGGSAFVIYGPILVVCIFAIALGGVYVWYKKKHTRDNHLITSVNPDYAGPLYQEDEWEIDRSDIEIIREIGQGSFGMVYEGVLKSRQFLCAIKTVNENASMPSRIEFLNEGSVMKTFNDAHHVIKLLGIVSRGQPPLVVMELMERGDLKSYLRRCREPSQNLTTNETYRMAAEIADGMAYLTAKKFVHRDLAARNCMVAADRTVKIGDFGMARDIYETDYYRKETVGLLPVRWMAPESLADGVFTSDSDVWSYGVVLWEMATLAEQPYKGMSNEEVFHFVKTRGRLERPPECSDFFYEIMDACWMWRPNDRPTFSDIVHRLVDHVGQDFRLVAFVFSRHGLELALNARPRVYNPPAMLAAPEADIWGHYDPDEEEVSLYVRESNRPSKYLPFSSQRPKKSSPYRVSPGSPASSTFSFDSSS